MALKAGTAIERRFSQTIQAGLAGANTRSYSGTTGRAAAKAGIVGSARHNKAV